MVWCLTKVAGGYSFYDSSGVFHEIDDCPKGFEYSIEGKSCIKTNSYKDKNPSVVITDKKSGGVIEVQTWKETDCK